MAIQHSIPKKTEIDDPNGFAALRKEGIETLQEMSGDVWTDYNLHDPGVTILEQLCYALTDLIDRSDYSAEDYLTDDDGNIRFREQTLHLPEDILPCRPSSMDDYREAMLSGCADIDNLWLDPADKTAAGPECAGVYTATVKLPDGVSREDVDKTNIRKQFVAQRNLCEDIHECIEIADSRDCHLNGIIEVDGSRDSADVLAQIYRCAASYIAASVHDGPLQPHEGKATPLDLFTGPLTPHGHVHLDDTGERGNLILIRDLIGAIGKIDSVVRVQDLFIIEMLSTGPRAHRESIKRRNDDGTLRLQMPQAEPARSKDDDPVRLIKRGRPLVVSIADTMAKYKQLQFVDGAARTTHSHPAKLYTLPSGKTHRFGRYYSLQNHFPNIYGINANGVPGSAPKQTQASAKQLKAYLILFEQILANHAANIEGVRNLFANVYQLGATYHYQVLDDTLIPGAEALYLQSPPGDFLQQTMATFDSRAERRSRQLDHMLAVFGERFTQQSLRHFNYYSSQQHPVQDIAKNKVAYLRHIVEVTRDRTGGSDYYTRDAVGGFARRVGLLLGFTHFTGSLKADVDASGIDLNRQEQFPPYRQTISANPDAQFRSIPFVPVDPKNDTQAFLAAKQILEHSHIGSTLLVDGTRLEPYRYQHSQRSGQMILILCSGEHQPVYQLAECVDALTAAKVANALQYELIRICRASEGMHIVEHVLLRPASAETTHAERQPLMGNTNLWEAFYPLRCSVFFPNWTARCHDTNFQRLAEETVRINSPAHVYGQCFWLTYAQMAEFEKLQTAWENARQSGLSRREVDNSAVRLIDYIDSMQTKLAQD